MALTGDRYVGTFEGHTIEFVRNNWVKLLKLLIDGTEVTRGSCMLPGRRTLTATLEHNGVPYEVVARSVPERVLFTKDTIEIDGQLLPLVKAY
jgi:hypothetical protein